MVKNKTLETEGAESKAIGTYSDQYCTDQMVLNRLGDDIKGVVCEFPKIKKSLKKCIKKFKLTLFYDVR